MRLPEETKKPPSNLVVDGALKDEVLLYLDLMKMAELVNHVCLGDVVVDFNTKTMRTNPKLPKEDPKSMHPMSNCEGGPNNKAISQL